MVDPQAFERQQDDHCVNYTYINSAASNVSHTLYINEYRFL